MTKKLCQSCGIPLDGKVRKGTKEDGTLYEKYCEYCYKDGEWTLNLSFDKMYAYNLNKLKESNMHKIEKLFLIKMYTHKFMKKLERWSDD